LNISYDANFYGANIPLGYQYQVYSAKYYPSNYLGLPDFFLSTFLYATVNQKTFRELVAYHAAATSDNIFLFPIQKISYTEPTHHWRRQNFLNALNAVDNGENIFPMPVASRNIAISLGKISGKNSDPGTVNPGGFKNAGDYWQNISALGFRFRTGAAKYMPSGQTFQIFRRQLPPVFLNPFQAVCKHEVNVSMMQEIDNAAGSYMNGIGNFISVSDWTFFPITQIWNGRDFYAHKPVVSALGINRNLWPSDGSMTVNVQNLKLMFNKFGLDYNSTDNSIQSDHYGYPNLGRPGDHFKITPFEAIYIDSKVNPHIDLRDDKSDDLDALNDFIFSEAEPWYLGLQNQVVGSRARSNFTYYVRRRARNIIFVGDSVTPSTDVGDYVVEPNVVLDLRAGEAIVLKPGTHFKAGSKVHLKIEFDGCSGSNLAQSSTASGSKGHEDVKERLEAVSDHTREEQNRIRLYPNPSNDGTFSLKSASEAVISTVRIYNMYGIPVHETANIEATEYRSQVLLQTGTYLVQVTVNSKTETLKLIVL
jgi:hypothetical protein